MAYIKTQADASPPQRRPLPWLPYRSTLRSGAAVELVRILPERPEHAGLIAAMKDLLNYEIVTRGDSYPFAPVALTDAQFREYYCGSETFALVLATPASSPATASDPARGVSYNFGAHLVGCFYVKPNYPYRSAGICNGGFLVVPQYQRKLGVGTLLGKCFVVLAADLGYEGSMFNLVYSTNAGSIKLWTALGFQNISRVPRAGKVKTGFDATLGQESTATVDALQFYGDIPAMAPGMRAALKIPKSPVSKL